jgi:hypothetical protein
MHPPAGIEGRFCGINTLVLLPVEHGAALVIELRV